MSEAMIASQNQQLEKHGKRALLVGRILLVLSLLNAIFYVYIGYNSGQQLLYLLSGALIVFVAMLLMAGRWIKNGRVYRGARTILFGVMLVGFTAGIVIANLGIIIALAVVMVIAVLSAIMLPQSQTLRAVPTSVGIGLLIIVADVFVPYTRVSIPEVEAFIPVLAAVMVVVFAIFIIRNFREYSLRAKLIIATLIVAVGAVVAVTVMVSLTSRNALEAQVGNNLDNLARAEGLAVGELLLRQINTLEALGFNRTILVAAQAKNETYPEDPTEIQKVVDDFAERWQDAASTEPLVLSILNNSSSRELLDFQDAFPANQVVFLTDQYGALIATTEQVEHFDYSDELWWQIAYEQGFGSIYIGNPEFDPDLGEIILQMAIPVRDEEILGRRNTIGILVTAVGLRELADVVLDGRFGETGIVDLYFTHETSRLDVDDINNYAVSSVNENDSMVVKNLLRSDDPYLTEFYRDASGLISSAEIATLSRSPQLERLDWNVVVFQAHDEALAPVERQFQTNLLMGTIIVVIAGVMAVFVAQILAQPIKELTNTAVAVAGGDYTARVSVTSGDEIGTLGNVFNDMTEQLQYAIEGLETRVEERTRALTASTEVSRSLSTILDPDQLVNEVVNQIKDAFNYYHVQIYLFDDRRQNLVMMSGTGDVGQIMLARQHAIPAGKGLVGQAAAMNAPVLIPDVTQSEEWLPSKLLPDTKAEMTVPIASADDVFGVLDVQHDVLNGLTNEDVQLLQAVANQVAVALQNAHLYASTQEQAQQEAVINAIGQQIQQANNMERVLQIAAQELGRTLDVERVIVQIHRDKTRNGQL